MNLATRRLVRLDIFRNGLENIYDRNTEDDILFTAEELSGCIEKSKMLIPEYERVMNKRLQILTRKMNDAAFDYKKVTDYRE